MKIREYMTKKVDCIQSDQTLRDASKLMWEGDIGALPVLDKKKQVIGMITDRDIAMAVYTTGKLLSDIPVSHSMSRSIVTCEEEDQLSVAEKAMQLHRIRRLPVLNAQKQLSGIISLNDIAVAFAKKDRGVEAKEVADTLSTICTHRSPVTKVSHAA